MTLLSSRFSDALTFATDLHKNQTRKISGIPYITHLLGVASLILEYGGGEDEAIAGLLHDAIEDQGGMKAKAEIIKRFGENVASIVEGCSEPYLKPKPPWKERKKRYLNQMATASDSVRLVATADKINNIRSLIKDYKILGENIWQYFHGKKEGTLWYYDSLVKEFSKNEITPIVELLVQVHQELNNLVNKSSTTSEDRVKAPTTN